MSSGSPLSPTSVSCPSCDFERVSKIGDIPSSNMFAGRTLPRPIDGGALWCCGRCNLYFRWPQLASGELEDLYKQGDAHTWSNEPIKRRDWTTASTWLHKTLNSGDSVLDVGCSTGLFLSEFLSGEINRFGIEINTTAATIARENGITILGENLDDSLVATNREKFSAVVAFDVIEHIRDPLGFLDACRAIVKPGGRILISTGDTSSMSWRFSGARYWYCTIPEHLSFINDKWLDYATRELDLTLIQTYSFSHSSAAVKERIRESILNSMNIAVPPVLRTLRRIGLGGLDVSKHPELVSHPPSWITAKDHILAEMSRN